MAWVMKQSAWNSPSFMQDAAGDPRTVRVCSDSLRPPESAAILLPSWMLYRQKSETSAQPKLARRLREIK